jgi:hypothetical protein
MKLLNRPSELAAISHCRRLRHRRQHQIRTTVKLACVPPASWSRAMGESVTIQINGKSFQKQFSRVHELTHERILVLAAAASSLVVKNKAFAPEQRHEPVENSVAV